MPNMGDQRDTYERFEFLFKRIPLQILILGLVVVALVYATLALLTVISGTPFWAQFLLMASSPLGGLYGVVLIMTAERWRAR